MGQLQRTRSELILRKLNFFFSGVVKMRSHHYQSQDLMLRLSYLTESGLKNKNNRTISTHSLRHTAGTLALRAGAELRQVQDLLGHADPRTTSIYVHVGDRWDNNPAQYWSR